MTTIHFMLMYDSCSGLTIKNKFSEKGVTDVQVGNFEMLLDIALDYRLISYKESIHWESSIANIISKTQNSFWHNSMEVDENAVINEVSESLNILLDSLFLDDEKLPEITSLDNSRCIKYYNDLRQLHNDSNNHFPAIIDKAKLLKSKSSENPIKQLVIYVDDSILLSNWQKEILEILNTDKKNYEYET